MDFSKRYSLVSFTSIALLSLVISIHSEAINYGEVCRSPENDNHTVQDHSNNPDDWDSYHDQGVDYCNFQNGLCIDNKCQCEFPELMIFNDRHCQCGAPTSSYCSEQVPCLAGNICENNVCICPSPSVPLADGSCSEGVYGICRWESDCTPNLFLTCLEGSCHCKNLRSTIFEQESDYGDEGCKIRAGESCSIGGQACVLNSGCIRRSSSDANTVCQCNEGYLPTPGGICLKDFDQTCTSGSFDCNEYRGLACINDTCQCIDQQDTFYSPKARSCLTYIGRPCGNIETLYGDNYNIGCGENAECTSSSVVSAIPNLRTVCKCLSGFSPEEIDGKFCVVP